MKTRTRLEIIPRTVDTNQRRIILNVGGRKHETFLSTVRNYPDTRLYWVVENVTKAIDHGSERIELFFDRHPGIFEQVLNYYRTGKLHCPHDVCGPLFEEELAYWGIDEKEMEHCCWTSYSQHRDAEQNLKSFNVRDGDQEQDTDLESDRLEEHSTPAARDCGRFIWWTKYQPNIWPILDDPHSSRAAKVFSIVSVILIMLSVGASCAITLPQFSKSSTTRKNVVFKTIDYLCGIWFTIELLLRIIFCPRRRVFFRQLSNWIDILSVLPFYLQLFDPDSDSLIQALLMIRLLRLFRFFRLLYGLQILLHTLKASSYELGLLLLILLIPVVLFSSIIYYVEQTAHNPQSNFSSIPVSLWWSLITMTTVGYGDMVPKTWAGKIIGGACSICGILVVALPISIIGGNFNLYYAHAQARLKLPRKRNRLLLSSITSDFSDRRSSSGTRRRGLRMRSNVPFETWDEESQVQRSRNGSKQRNSIPKKNSTDTSRNSRTWSIPSSKSDHALGNNNDVRLSPTSTRGNIERRYSRNERVSPKLCDLPEKDETEEIETSGNHLQNAKLHSRVKSYSPSERLPLWLSENTRVPRIRSSSVPSNAQRPPRSGPPPRKTKSQSSPICRRCLLPKAIPSAYETEQSQDSSPEICCCLGKREISRESPNSTYTIYIPGVDEGVQVSMESLPSWSRELPFDYGSPIQLDFVPNLSNLSDEDSDSANDLQDQDEHGTITSELNDESNSESKKDQPLLKTDMPNNRASMTDQETSI